MRLTFSTEALASASARHPWRVIAVWLLAIAGSLAIIGTLLSGALTTAQDLTNNPESERADALLEDWRGPDHDIEIVLVHSDTLTVDDATFQAKVIDMSNRIISVNSDVVLAGTNYYWSGDEMFVSADRRTTYMLFAMTGDEENGKDNIGTVLAITDPEDQGQFRVLNAGNATLDNEIQDIAVSDLRKGETVGAPIALLVLVLVIGALTAAIIPLILAIVSVIVALALTALLGQAFPFSFLVTNIITMAGLAIGIDYSLFIVSRYREERARGLDKHEAIHAAGATASRSVLFSGLTVVLALLGMLLVPSTIFRSLGAGAIIVAVASVLVTLTLLPAILGLLGDHINSLRVPYVGRDVDKLNFDNHGGFWDRVTQAIMRYPVLSLVAACGVLIALAVPFLDLNTGSAGVRTLPHSTESYESFTILQDEFNVGDLTPIEIVVQNRDVGSEAVRASTEHLQTALASNPLFGDPRFGVKPDRSLLLVTVSMNVDPETKEATNAVRNLRDEVLPAAFGDSGSQLLVTGQTAREIDYIDTTTGYTPIVFIFVLGLSFVLLTIVFRSLVVPLKAIVMNLLSVGASYGALVLVFQKGFLNEVFGFQQVDVIEAWVPLWTFSILFGLSMDYHVFLLSRIRERFNKTDDNKESVAFGVRSTAGIITGAALIMASVFGGVALGDLVMFQQMGFGLAVAVLLDATIVRSVIVPAAMELLGRANWYLPNFLRWLPEVRTEAPQEAGDALDPHPTLRPGAGTP